METQLLELQIIKDPPNTLNCHAAGICMTSIQNRQNSLKSLYFVGVGGMGTGDRQLITNIIHMVFWQEMNAIKIKSKLWEDWEFRVGEDENYH